MSDFTKAVNVLLQHEGGLVSNPNDSGGITNFGISLRFLSGLTFTDGDINEDGKIDAQDIINMNKAQAAALYKKYWWDKYNYGAIIDQTLATKVFDFAVNMGANRAHILLQRALNDACGLNLTTDGVLGNASFSAINHVTDGAGEQALITAYCNQAWSFYQQLIAKNSSLQAFANGWKNRAFAISKANSIS